MEISDKRKCFYIKSIFKFFFLSEVNFNINHHLNICNLLHFLSCLAKGQNRVNCFSKMVWVRKVVPVQPEWYFFNDLFDNLSKNSGL